MDQNKYSQISAQAILNVQELRLAQSEWKLLKQGNYLKIFCQQYKNTDAYTFKITGEIPADFMVAQKFYFENNEGMAKNRENCDGIDLIEDVDKDNSVCLIKMSSPNTTTLREFLIVRNRSSLSNNEVLIVNSQLDNHAQAPLSDNSTREYMAINAQIINKVSSNSSSLEIYFLRDFSKAVPVDQLPQIGEAFQKFFEKDVEKILSLQQENKY
ncbi:hypothetical protein ABPG72_000474 [Tetrahymena utriculariae]